MLPGYLIAIGFFILSLFLSPGSVLAQGKGTLTIEPATVEVTLSEASSEAQMSFTLTNKSDQPVTLAIFPLDFRQQDEFGRIALLDDPGSYSYSLSSFLSFETNFVELGPGDSQVIKATAANRIDLTPGGHYAAVVARLVQDNSKTSVAPAVSAMILLRKTGGEQFNLSLKDVEWPKNVFSLTYDRSIRLLFQNEGNIHLVPYGRVEIKDMFGRMLYKGVINSPSSKVFPGSRRYVSVDLKKMAQSYPISFNTFSLRGNDSLKETTFQYETSFIYINPVLLGVIILAPIAVVLMRRRRNSK